MQAANITTELEARLRANLSDALCKDDMAFLDQLLQSYQQQFDEIDHGQFYGRLLWDLVKRHEVAAVRLLLSRCPNDLLEKMFHFQSADSISVVHLAVLERQPGLIAVLAHAGASLCMPDGYNQLPMDYACQYFDFATESSQDTLTVLLQLHAGMCFDFTPYPGCYEHISSIENLCLYGVNFGDYDNIIGLFLPEDIARSLPRPTVDIDPLMSELEDGSAIISHIQQLDDNQLFSSEEYPTQLIFGVNISLRKQLEIRCLHLFSTVCYAKLVSPLCAAVFPNWTRSQTQNRTRSFELSSILEDRIQHISYLLKSLQPDVDKVHKGQVRKKFYAAIFALVVYAILSPTSYFLIPNLQVGLTLAIVFAVLAPVAALFMGILFNPRPPSFAELNLIVADNTLNDVIDRLKQALTSDTHNHLYNVTEWLARLEDIVTLRGLVEYLAEFKIYCETILHNINLGGDVSSLELDDQLLLINEAGNDFELHESHSLGDVWLGMEFASENQLSKIADSDDDQEQLIQLTSLDNDNNAEITEFHRP